MKKIIRLTESDLHRIVKESVKRILRENDAARKAADAAKAAADAAWAAGAGAGYSKDNVKKLAGRKAADAVPNAAADAARKAADAAKAAAARKPAQTARDAARKAADAAKAAAAPGSASRKK